TALHVGLGPAAERGPVADVVPEDVTCRDLRDRQVRREELGLRPLARTRGAHEDDTHYRRKPSSLRCWSWLSICFTVSSPTPTAIRMLAPPNGKFWVAPTSASAIIGISAMIPRYTEPGAVSRVST